MTLITFAISALMGSGMAFFSFAPMVPDISRHIGSDIAVMMLPIQISAGIGRTLSPIAGVIIAIAGIAGVSPVDIVKRTAIPDAGRLATDDCANLCPVWAFAGGSAVAGSPCTTDGRWLFLAALT